MESTEGRHLRRSVRLPGFDYSRIGMYFITICAAQRRCIFGEVSENIVVLNRTGEIAKACWIEIPRHFPNVKVETFVVMPNHLHGILTIHSMRQRANRHDERAMAKEAFGSPTHSSIPTMVRSFKSAATKLVRESGLAPGKSIWQRGYFEHVIRNTEEYVEVTNYILLNPAQWAHDEDNLDRELGDG